ANYTWFFLADGRKIIVSKTLKEFDSLFESKYFFRAHQSHLINLLHFDRYEKKDGGIVHMKDGSELPVAVRKKDSLMSALERL
ncbi:MAG: LytTR family DNA-binding domain-containing protein, partial [Cyclobacteriaceae bacterium]